MTWTNDGAAHGPHTTLTPLQLREIITEDNTALRALGALLRTARLADFDRDAYYDRKDEADRLQHGLCQLVNLYLEKQERVLDTYAEQYQSSDEYVLEQAAGVWEAVKQGAFLTGYGAKRRLREVLTDLETVIERDGQGRPRAEELKAAILQHDVTQAASSAQGTKRMEGAS